VSFSVAVISASLMLVVVKQYAELSDIRQWGAASWSRAWGEVRWNWTGVSVISWICKFILKERVQKISETLTSQVGD